MESHTPTFADKSGRPLSLLLYKRDTCGFCHLVLTRARELNLQLPMRDTGDEPEARQDLIRIGGKGQVPCLIVNDKPMYESTAIIRFLEEQVQSPT